MLRSKRAIQINLAIIRAFIQLRELMATHKDLARKMEKLEGEQKHHSKLIVHVFEQLRKLQELPKKPKRQIGFSAGK